MGGRCTRRAEDPGNSARRKSNFYRFHVQLSSLLEKKWGPALLHRVLEHNFNTLEFCIVYVHIFLASSLLPRLSWCFAYVSPGISSPSVGRRQSGKYVDHAVRKIQTQQGPTHQSVALLVVRNHTFNIGPCRLKKKKCCFRGCYF